MSLPIAAFVLAATLADEGASARLRVECEGEVEWVADGEGGSRLSLAGGVRATRGDILLRARRAQVLFEKGTDAPSSMRAEIGVVVESPRFRATSARAELSPRAGAAGEGSHFELRLEPADRGEVELAADGLLVRCGGPLVYDSSRREARLTGRVRGEGRLVRFSSDEATVTFAPAAPQEAPRSSPPRKEPRPEAAPGARPPEQIAAVEAIELRGSVEFELRAVGDAPPRRARADSARYEAANELVVLSPGADGRPPEIESAGVKLSAPEIRIHLRENRIESPTGKLRAVVEPSAQPRGGSQGGQ